MAPFVCACEFKIAIILVDEIFETTIRAVTMTFKVDDRKSEPSGSVVEFQF